MQCQNFWKDVTSGESCQRARSPCHRDDTLCASHMERDAAYWGKNCDVGLSFGCFEDYYIKLKF
jgi:hypothetical protein